MKKLFVLLFLMVIGTSVYAQKSYVNVYVTELNNTYPRISMSGDVPSIPDTYHKEIGEVLNYLAQEGFEVEFMAFSSATYAGNNPASAMYLLSKKSSSTNPEDPDIVTYQNNISEDAKAHEVARYNLQGLPVNRDEKGVQIVVYSNYTTKTIIKE